MKIDTDDRDVWQIKLTVAEISRIGLALAGLSLANANHGEDWLNEVVFEIENNALAPFRRREPEDRDKPAYLVIEIVRSKEHGPQPQS
jgi:hypothetical protein